MEDPKIGKTIKSVDSKVTKLRRRKKPVKSCSFCRQRKLKCDQVKPICSSCKSRQLKTCIYSNQIIDVNLNTDDLLDRNLNNNPNKNIKLNNLDPSEIQLLNANKENDTSVITASTSNDIDSTLKNPIRNTTSMIDLTTENNTTLALLEKISNLEKQVNSIMNYNKNDNTNAFNNENIDYSPANNSKNFSTNKSNITNQSPASTVSMHTNNSTTPLVLHDNNSAFQNYNLNESNPLNSFYYMQIKESGRRIIYGPTSMRTNLFKHRFGFGEKYTQLWKKVKVERNKWKKKNKHSKLRELELVDATYDKNYTSVLNQVCDELPSYEACLKLIKSFFDPQFISLYFIVCILDERKVLEDFYKAFIPDTEKLLPDGSRKVKTLVPGPKKNFYKIGVLLMIITCTSYYDYLPDSFEIFYTNLCGQSSCKIYYIERLQFLLLRYQYNIIYMPDADSTHLISITSLCVSTAITLGLNRNIDVLYEGQEEVVGNLESLKNIWCIVTFIDFQSSFQIGKPLELNEIGLDYQDSEIIPATHPHLKTLRKLTKLGRSIMKSLLARNGVPKFNDMMTEVLQFFENEIPPLSYFIDEKLILQVNVYDIKIASTCLDLLLSLNNLRFSILGELTSDYGLHYGLISLSMLNAITKRCYYLDKKHFPGFFENNVKKFPPYLSLSIFLTSGLVARASTIINAIIYFNLTIFQANEFLLIDHDTTKLWDLSQLRINEQKNDVNILGALDAYYSISESWLRPSKTEIKRILARSSYFTITNAMQMTFKKVLDNALEYRKKAEELWKNQINKMSIHDDIIGTPAKMYNKALAHWNLKKTEQNSSSNNLKIPSFRPFFDSQTAIQSPSVASTPALPNDKNHAQFIQPNGIPFNDKMTSVPASETPDSQSNKEMEILQTIADDFWLNYNSNWEKFLDQTNPEDLFNNL